MTGAVLGLGFPVTHGTISNLHTYQTTERNSCPSWRLQWRTATARRRKKRWLIITIVSVAVVALVIVAVAATRGGTKIDPTKLAKVEKGDLAKSVVATGKVTPITKVEIKSKASGIVKKLYVDAGDKVKQGQVLAELDRVEIEAQVNSARAQLLSSEANLKGAEADLKRAEVDAQGVDIPTLQRAYERAQEMSKDGVVSQSTLDDAQTELHPGGQQARCCPRAVHRKQGKGRTGRGAGEERPGHPEPA